MDFLGKLGLALADCDGDYIGSLSDYLLKHHAQSFDIYTFDSVESLNAFFSGDARRVNILLAGPGFIHSGIPSGGAEAVILLDDGNTDITGEGIPSVKRYQHAEKLVSAIFSIYSKKNSTGRLPAGKNSTLIAAFISPSGGTGKSVISAGCSILCAGWGMKVFYLNLERAASTGFYFKGDSDQNFSNVLYYLKDKGVNPGIKAAGARCVDVATGVHFFVPPESQLEMSSLQPGDLKRLLDGFKSAAVYDAVFVDMPGMLDECGIAAMNEADRVVCVCGTDSASRFKNQSLRAEYELLERRYRTGLMDKMIYAVNDIRNLGAGSCLDAIGKIPTVIFKEDETLSNTMGWDSKPDFGADFMSGISMLVEKINPAWNTVKSAEAGGKTLEAWSSIR